MTIKNNLKTFPKYNEPLDLQFWKRTQIWLEDFEAELRSMIEEDWYPHVLKEILGD